MKKWILSRRILTIASLVGFIALMLLAATPPPQMFLNAWTTNQSVLPVFGDNNLSISNRVAGPGGGTNWNFYGIGPNTVARLKDITNAGSGIFVLQFNGTSDSQTLTNPVISGQLNFGYPSISANQIIIGDGMSGLTGFSDFSWDEGVQTLSAVNQTNSGTLDVAGTLSTYAGINDIGGLSESGISSFSTGVKFPTMTPGKLANYVNIGGATYLSNSVYGDTDIAALQAATNALTAAIGNTNLYVKIQSGTMNNVTSTNGNFYSPTNTSQVSNQVTLTLNGLTGQNTNLMEVFTNTTSTKTVIDAQGRIGINTNVPSHKLEVAGDIAVAPGASQAPTYGFNNGANHGIYSRSAGFITITKGSDGDLAEFTSGSFELKSNVKLGWSATTVDQVADTAIGRQGINTNFFGTVAGTGSILASNLVQNGVHVFNTTTNYISFSATNVPPASTTPKVWITVTIGGATYWIGGCQ